MAVTYASILKELKTKIYHPVYFFTGEEPYYIDLLTQYIEDNVLDEMEKELFTQRCCCGDVVVDLAFV